MMSGDLEVTVSGEGDFEMTTDCAWRVEIAFPDGRRLYITPDGVQHMSETVWPLETTAP